MRRSFDLHLLLELACSPDNPFICFANYSAPLVMAPETGAFKSAGVLFTPTASFRRIQLYEAEFGQNGVLPTTDCQCQWDLSRILNTALMAGSVVPTNLLDPADVASATLFMNNLTTDPTYTTAGAGLFLKSWSINMRGSYRWRALDDGDNILVAAAATNGVGIRTLSNAGTFVGSAIGGLSFIER